MKWILGLVAIGFLVMSKNLNIIGTSKDIFSDKYDELFIRAAKKHGIDPVIVKAIAANESMVGKYQQLEKIGGTTGIMHIKLATAQMFNKNLTQIELNNPEIEIDYGVRYLKWLFDRYSRFDYFKRIQYTVMAYNGGPGRVDQLIKDPEKYQNENWFKNVSTYLYRFTNHVNKLKNIA